MKVEEIKLSLEKNREHHVQFALIDDVRKVYSNLTSSKQKFESEFLRFIGLKKSITDNANAFISEKKKADVLLDKIKKQAEGIGVSVVSIKEYSDILEIFNDIKEADLIKFIGQLDQVKTSV